MGYDAFISYSHAADGRLAPALQRGMQRMAKPWFRLRSLRVFRDESALSANPHLWESIETALDDSEWFVLLASPESAESVWVDRELRYWLSNAGSDRLLVVVTGGIWTWDQASKSLTGDAVPQALRESTGDEPRHVDLRWAHSDTDFDPHNASFRDAVADVCAPIHGVPKDDLESEDVRLYRRSRRVARGGAAAMATLLLLTLIFGAETLKERNVANHQALDATVQEAVAESQALSTKQPDVALLLASAATKLIDDPETQSALINSVNQSPHLIRMFRASGAVRTGALSPDGKSMAIISDQGVLQVGPTPDPAKGSSVMIKDGKAVNRIEFSPDGRYLATLGVDGTVQIVDSHGHSVSGLLRDPSSTQPISAAAFSPDGQTLATISGWNDVLLWNVRTGQMSRRIARDHAFDIATPDLSFTPDGSHLLVSSAPAESYDLRTGARSTFIGMPYPGYDQGDTLTSVAVRPDGRQIAASSSKAISFHSAATDQEVKRYEMGAELVRYAPSGKMLAVAQSDGSIEIVPADLPGTDVTPTPSETTTLIGHDKSVNVLDFSANSQTLLSASAGEVALWDLSGPAALHTELPGDGRGVNGVAYSPNGGMVAAARDDGSVGFWDARTGRRLGKQVNVSPATLLGAVGVAFSPDGKTLAVGSSDGTVAAIDVRTHRVLRSVQVTPRPKSIDDLTTDSGIYQVEFSPDGRTIAAGVGDSTVALVDAQTWRIDRILSTGHTGITLGLAFNPSGTLLAASDFLSGDHQGVSVFSLKSDRIVWSRSAQNGATGVAFTPNGSDLAVAFYSSPTIIYDTTHWRPVAGPLVSNDGYVLGISYAPNGSELVEATEAGSTILWNLASGTPSLSELGKATDRVADVAFSPSGRQIVSGSSDASLSLWSVDESDWAHRACLMAGRTLSPGEWRQYLGSTPYRNICPNDPSV